MTGTNDTDDELRALQAAAFGRGGAGLSPEQARRLVALRRGADDPAETDTAVESLDPVDVAPTAEATDSAPATSRRRYAVTALVAALAVTLAFVAGWVLSPRPSITPIESAGDELRLGIIAPRGDMISQSIDPDSILYLGIFSGAAWWEGASMDGENRCFAQSSVVPSFTPGQPEVSAIVCERESAGELLLASLPFSGPELRYRGEVRLVARWGAGEPANVASELVDVQITPLDTSTLVARTREAAAGISGGASGEAYPVAVAGVTALWALAFEGKHCVYAITPPATQTAQPEGEQGSCIDDAEFDTGHKWFYPGPEFGLPESHGALATNIRVSWSPDTDPSSTIVRTGQGG